MIMQMDRIVYIKDKGNFIIGGVRKEDYSFEGFKDLIGNNIWIEGKNGEKIILNVLGIETSISISGDYIVGIRIKQNIRDEEIKNYTFVHRYNDK